MRCRLPVRSDGIDDFLEHCGAAYLKTLELTAPVRIDTGTFTGNHGVDELAELQ